MAPQASDSADKQELPEVREIKRDVCGMKSRVGGDKTIGLTFEKQSRSMD